ncbi:hypothetical protein [Albidovulum sediminis]|jgi:hypothetical protein|uniref:Uncharacterized protein n=1 Tax=Albidovulum sediminis TaxID=3066345 RepID=A0ABT2NIU7_9RHOB|nr:hypothetical protein [Defluviimonas sediminis]MCT8328018.1 hypothetical protein [Defluviimonas sediminis]
MTRFLVAALIGAGLVWGYLTVNPSARAGLGLPQTGGVLTGAPARGVANGIGNLAGRVFD